MPLLEALIIKGLIVAVKSGAVKGLMYHAAHMFSAHVLSAGVGAATAQAAGAVAAGGAVLGGVKVAQNIASKSQSAVKAVANRNYKEAALSTVELALEAKTLSGAGGLLDVDAGIGLKELTKEAVKGTVKEGLEAGIGKLPLNENKKRAATAIQKELISRAAKRL
jgi:hypothetical protein